MKSYECTMSFRRRGMAAAVILAALLLAVTACSDSGAGSGGGSGAGGETGTVEGFVVDATTASPLGGVVVRLAGDSSVSTTTDAAGYYTLTLPAGLQELILSLSGYHFSNVVVSVVPGETIDGYAVGSPDLIGDGVRFVLTWGADPADLDSHLLTPGGHHVYYSNASPLGAGAMLDWDDTNGHGPETVTITDEQAGTYTYYVHRYSGYPELAGCGATVSVYDEDGFLFSRTVPSSGSGDYWVVCTYDGQDFTTINTVQGSAP